jgi:hypothetical protein
VVLAHILSDVLEAVENVSQFLLHQVVLHTFVLQELWHEFEEVFGVVTVWEGWREGGREGGREGEYLAFSSQIQFAHEDIGNSH